MRRAAKLPRLAVDADSLFGAGDGRKQAAICTGRKELKEGLAMIADGDDRELVRVTRCTHKRVSSLTERDAMLEGVSGAAQLKTRLKVANPGLTDANVVTIVEFVPLCGEVVNRE